MSDLFSTLKVLRSTLRDSRGTLRDSRSTLKVFIGTLRDSSSTLLVNHLQKSKTHKHYFIQSFLALVTIEVWPAYQKLK